PLTLGPLLGWASRERLLPGQRSRRTGLFITEMRNVFAHGRSYRMGTPNESARYIHDLAETINRLWGVSTPGGRLYPAPLVRDVVAVAWSQGQYGFSHSRLLPDQLSQLTGDGETSTCLLLMAVADDDDLFEFDERYELTRYPCDLLWGPGTAVAASNW